MNFSPYFSRKLVFSTFAFFVFCILPSPSFHPHFFLSSLLHQPFPWLATLTLFFPYVFCLLVFFLSLLYFLQPSLHPHFFLSALHLHSQEPASNRAHESSPPSLLPVLLSLSQIISCPFLPAHLSPSLPHCLPNPCLVVSPCQGCRSGWTLPVGGLRGSTGGKAEWGIRGDNHTSHRCQVAPEEALFAGCAARLGCACLKVFFN